MGVNTQRYSTMGTEPKDLFQPSLAPIAITEPSGVLVFDLKKYQQIGVYHVSFVTLTGVGGMIWLGRGRLIL